eukprot:TRINITY_DN7825_c0_g1_i1.p1 TRINITY_DN7825_c0_g1~~TRINITY_DN7825_c0_g1_i1.p1  ORF type:complete len:1032 (+),score=158.24 TRINITY_DN7825_c0_g1_i1:378-3473(+)
MFNVESMRGQIWSTYLFSWEELSHKSLTSSSLLITREGSSIISSILDSPTPIKRFNQELVSYRVTCVPVSSNQILFQIASHESSSPWFQDNIACIARILIENLVKAESNSLKTNLLALTRSFTQDTRSIQFLVDSNLPLALKTVLLHSDESIQASAVAILQEVCLFSCTEMDRFIQEDIIEFLIEALKCKSLILQIKLLDLLRTLAVYKTNEVTSRFGTLGTDVFLTMGERALQMNREDVLTSVLQLMRVLATVANFPGPAFLERTLDVLAMSVNYRSCPLQESLETNSLACLAFTSLVRGMSQESYHPPKMIDFVREALSKLSSDSQRAALLDEKGVTQAVLYTVLNGLTIVDVNFQEQMFMMVKEVVVPWITSLITCMDSPLQLSLSFEILSQLLSCETISLAQRQALAIQLVKSSFVNSVLVIASTFLETYVALATAGLISSILQVLHFVDIEGITEEHYLKLCSLSTSSEWMRIISEPDQNWSSHLGCLQQVMMAYVTCHVHHGCPTLVYDVPLSPFLSRFVTSHCLSGIPESLLVSIMYLHASLSEVPDPSLLQAIVYRRVSIRSFQIAKNRVTDVILLWMWNQDSLQEHNDQQLQQFLDNCNDDEIESLSCLLSNRSVNNAIFKIARSLVRNMTPNAHLLCLIRKSLEGCDEMSAIFMCSGLLHGLANIAQMSPLQQDFQETCLILLRTVSTSEGQLHFFNFNIILQAQCSSENRCGESRLRCLNYLNAMLLKFGEISATFKAMITPQVKTFIASCLCPREADSQIVTAALLALIHCGEAWSELGIPLDMQFLSHLMSRGGLTQVVALYAISLLLQSGRVDFKDVKKLLLTIQERLLSGDDLLACACLECLQGLLKGPWKLKAKGQGWHHFLVQHILSLDQLQLKHLLYLNQMLATDNQKEGLTIYFTETVVANLITQFVSRNEHCLSLIEQHITLFLQLRRLQCINERWNRILDRLFASLLREIQASPQEFSCSRSSDYIYVHQVLVAPKYLWGRQQSSVHSDVVDLLNDAHQKQEIPFPSSQC